MWSLVFSDRFKRTPNLISGVVFCMTPPSGVPCPANSTHFLPPDCNLCLLNSMGVLYSAWFILSCAEVHKGSPGGCRQSNCRDPIISYPFLWIPVLCCLLPKFWKKHCFIHSSSFYIFLQQEDKPSTSYFNLARSGKSTVSAAKEFGTTGMGTSQSGSLMSLQLTCLPKLQ